MAVRRIRIRIRVHAVAAANPIGAPRASVASTWRAGPAALSLPLPIDSSGTR